jgi:glyoxylase-like metal-dependent hydrolase (beta-lactamase superfamily II)
LQASLDPNGHAFSGQPHIPELLDKARGQLSASTAPEQKAQLTERIRQLEAFQREMQNYENVLPTVTFEKTYVIPDKAHDLHVEFHGRGHTGGDVVVFCPQKRVVATGDLILNSLPFMADCFPEEWPKTIDSVAKLPLDFVLGGHGDYQHGKQPMLSERDYLEELATRVAAGKKAGQSLSEIQVSMPVASIKALQSNGYGELIRATWRRMNDARANDLAAMQAAVNLNIGDVFDRLAKS